MKQCLLLLCLLVCTSNVLANQKSTTKIIYIYTYDDFPKHIADNAVRDLKKVYPADKIIVMGKVAIPESAKYKSSRVDYKRLWAPTLLKYQMNLHKGNCIVLAFTTKDIASDVNHKDKKTGKIKTDKDWGIFGLGSQYWHSCVCSLYRMSNKSDKVFCFSKLVQHELGHCFGLPHCTNSSTCIISDAEGKYHLPRLKGYCPKCKKKLNALGWKL